MLRSVKSLRGYQLRATDGEIGKVKDVYFDDHTWTARYLVIDTGGWLTGRQVLISPNTLRGVDPASELLAVSLTRGQVENSPSIYEDQPVSRQHEAELADYYGYPYYWSAAYAGIPSAYPIATVPPVPLEPTGLADGWSKSAREEGDPHLRSAEEVMGYRIQAEDGEIGHVEDFLLDDDSWRIQAMVVDTRDWLPGKKVLLSPESIEEVDWPGASVHVRLRRDEVEGQPGYNGSALVG